MTAVNDSGKSVSLDDVLTNFSIFGRYHVKLGTLMFLAFMSNAMYCTNYVFAVEQVDYSCKHSPHQCDVHPTNLTDNFNSQCFERVAIRDDASCAVDGNSRVVPCTEWTFPGPIGFVEEFEIACHEWKRTLVGTVHSFAYMVGLLIIGPMSDRVGRKAALIMTGVLGGVFGLAKSFSTAYWMYISSEFLESAFGDACSPAFVFVVESVAAKDRARYYMLTQFGYQAGGLVMTLIAWNFPYFRTFLRVEYAPALLFILYLFFLDESPRWLLTKGRKDEALAILEKAAKMSKVDIDKGMLEKVSCEKDDDIRDVGYVALLKTTFSSKVILKRFLICLFWWTTCTFVSYGVTINSVLLAGNKYVNYALLTLVDIPASIIMGYVLIYFNRKKPLFFSFLCAALFFIIQPFLPSDMVWLSMTFFMAGKFMTSLFFNIVYVITSELFPTYTRNSMHALCSSLGRVGSILAPQTPLLVAYWKGFPSLLFGSMALIASLLTLLVPDTGDDALPDTIHQAEAVGSKPVVSSSSASQC